ncbi:L,D-transpeptidase [Tenacibaculum larymnensis]|uniref:L,D-transpeptidase n=1 Tax=Tenacibaculum larymnensis TaxID=2878201 RepID=A0A9X4IMS5_9FLAO|nr:L,D-transpeptidase [Tenacibaculum larymnensis]MDE1207938.1 L,D-transpeptidase [Tenacibaculum larymnensis]
MSKILKITFTLAFMITLKVCLLRDENTISKGKAIDDKAIAQSTLPIMVKVCNNIIVENYFEYIDSIVKKYDSLVPYTLTEHLLVRSNPWVIDTLQNTDYYRMKAMDSFVFSQKKMIVLPMGSLIVIPDSTAAKKVLNSFQKTSIDINIPEFKLRIYEDSLKLYDFPIRVGRNEKKYLKMSDRIEDLKTKTGKGFIVNYVRKPRYVNPVNNHEYFTTKRDDDKRTELPQIPFIETEINGIRNGQMIHPTTNPITLGKAYSHGCIGTREADAWVIYYYAPIGTKIKIRYDLEILDKDRQKKYLNNIYKK